ncbi:MAG: sulfatase [Planctomycetes bacterium]|nr:sulfatase [Planctomycetota bacterium]
MFVAVLACFATSSTLAAPPNVLFIAVDDLRPELGCYGVPVQSPNIDQFAREGTLFERAYVQCALCMPSRASVLTGRRPDTTGVVDFSVRFRDVLGDVVTLPQHFKNNGYHAAAFGKLFHHDDPASWSERLWQSNRKPYHTEFGNQVLGWIKEDHRRLTYVWDLGDGVEKTKRPGGLAWEAPDVSDDALRDGDIANAAIGKMSELKDQPFFLAVGFHKPHLPFIAPKKYFDLYDRDEIALATNPFPPRDAPKFATYNWNDLRHYYGIPDVGPVSEQQARELKHAYYACVSFMDAQVGRVLKSLDDLGLRDNTIVVLWGDHGWQLGEHGMWDKHSNFETSTHAPLIIRTPGQTPARTKALVEFVDIYPTLCELSGLSVDEGLEGQSFAPLIENPNRAWKDAAFSQYKRVIPGYGQVAPGMGYSMRTDRYRLTEWLVPGTEFRAYELYDHQSDPDENVNLAGASKHRMLVDELKTKLHAGWQAASP